MLHVLVFLILVMFIYGQIQNSMGYEWDVYIEREGLSDMLELRDVKFETCESVMDIYKTDEYYQAVGATGVYCTHQNNVSNPWWRKYIPTIRS